jgi:hypothetical protein
VPKLNSPCRRAIIINRIEQVSRVWDKVVFGLMNKCRKEKEFISYEREATTRLNNATFSQDNILSSCRQCPAYHCPLFEGRR